MARLKSLDSLERRLEKHIIRHGRGAVFTPKQFAHTGTTAAVEKALQRLAKAGTIRRLARGLYDYPKMHPELGPLSPTAEAIAKAIARRDRVHLQPTGAHAANLLRLSDQVPMKVQFLTDGPTRRIRVGRREITFKRTSPRNVAAANRTSGLVIQALRHLGKSKVTNDRIKHLRTLLLPGDRLRLLHDLRLAPAWMHPHLRFIADGDAR